MKQRTHPRGLPEWRNEKVGHFNKPKRVAARTAKHGIMGKPATNKQIHATSGWKGKIPRPSKKLGKK